MCRGDPLACRLPSTSLGPTRSRTRATTAASPRSTTPMVIGERSSFLSSSDLSPLPTTAVPPAKIPATCRPRLSTERAPAVHGVPAMSPHAWIPWVPSCPGGGVTSVGRDVMIAAPAIQFRTGRMPPCVPAHVGNRVNGGHPGAATARGAAHSLLGPRAHPHKHRYASPRNAQPTASPRPRPRPSRSPTARWTGSPQQRCG